MHTCAHLNRCPACCGHSLAFPFLLARKLPARSLPTSSNSARVLAIVVLVVVAVIFLSICGKQKCGRNAAVRRREADATRARRPRPPRPLVFGRTADRGADFDRDDENPDVHHAGPSGVAIVMEHDELRAGARDDAPPAYFAQHYASSKPPAYDGATHSSPAPLEPMTFRFASSTPVRPQADTTDADSLPPTYSELQQQQQPLDRQPSASSLRHETPL
eukprot:m.595535 g.595535  ORF g.595535 m.595535 type:complete len:218 (-) comp58041_c0_seq40:190-843(-)